jgi:KaiC/GvpD/RAD55 family RecA-like ATPase
MLSARDTAFRIAEIADAVVAGRASLDDIYTMLEKHEQVTEDSRALHEAVLDCTPEQAFEDLYLSGGMQWSLDFLNRNIGPLQKGTFIIFGASPDTGKTTFLMDEASHFLKQGHRVVWFNNEERDRKVYFRLVQSTLGKTKQEIENDPKILDAFEQYKDNLFMVNIRKLKPQEVELLLDELQPDVVVFDQLYKMPGFNRKDNDVQRIHSLFIWARELAANKDCAVITAHLADAEAAGKEFPEMHMLYMGKTGPQSEADFIVMMGRSFEESNGFVRGLNIVKLKETMPGCDPVMRTYIEIDPYRVEVRELENE